MKLAICLFAVGFLIGVTLVARLADAPAPGPASEPEAVLPDVVSDPAVAMPDTIANDPAVTQTVLEVDALIGQPSGTRARAIALAYASTQDYAPDALRDSLLALAEADQRAFQLALVSEWAAVDGTAALLYASGLEPSLRRRAVERVARASAQMDPFLALQAGSMLRTRDAYFYRRNVFEVWARNDLDAVYTYLDGAELTTQLADTIPIRELARAPERLLALSERAPGSYRQMFADTARDALDE